MASPVSFQLHPPFGVLSMLRGGEKGGELTHVFCTTIIILYFITYYYYYYYYYYCSSTVEKTGKNFLGHQKKVFRRWCLLQGEEEEE